MMYPFTLFTQHSNLIRKPGTGTWLGLVTGLIMTTTLAMAQEQASPASEGGRGPAGKLSVGATSGGVLNRFTGQPQAGFSTGYTGGLFANYQVYPQFFVQVEGNYLQQGGQLITFKDDTRYGQEENLATKNVKNSHFKLHSLEIPLLLQYAPALRQSWRPVVYLGGSAALTLAVTERYQKTGDLLPGEDIIATVRAQQKVEGQFEGQRYNFIAGSGVQLPLFSKLQLLLDFRYVLGLSPARQNYSYMEKAGFGTDIRSSSFISRIGVAFPIQ
jgi:hypothetical protein